MAVIVKKWNDLDAPDFTTEAQGAGCMVAAMRHFLVDTFLWTLVHDSTRRATGTATEGRLIIKPPSGAYVVVWDEKGDDMTVGLGDDAFSDGTVTNYQSGLSSTGGAYQTHDCLSPAYWSAWHAVYDEASETFLFECSYSTFSKMYYTSSTQIYRVQVYLSTAATPTGARDTFPVLGAGNVKPTNGAASSFYGVLLNGWTTLKKLDGTPANGDSLMYISEDSAYRGALYEDTSAPDRVTGLKRIDLNLSNNWANYPDNRDHASMIGELRGIWAIGTCDHSRMNNWLNVQFPTLDQQAEGSRFGAEVTLGGKAYVLTGDNYNWIGLISLDPADYGEMV